MCCPLFLLLSLISTIFGVVQGWLATHNALLFGAMFKWCLSCGKHNSYAYICSSVPSVCFLDNYLVASKSQNMYKSTIIQYPELGLDYYQMANGNPSYSGDSPRHIIYGIVLRIHRWLVQTEFAMPLGIPISSRLPALPKPSLSHAMFMLCGK